MAKRVAVVGAGFAGTMTAVQLARRGLAATLIGRPPQVGKGVAYSTADPAHLLNIAAGKMGAWPDAPGDFAAATGAEPAAYVPRMLYGDYLRAILDAAAVEVIAGDAVAAEPNAVGPGWTIQLADGSRVEADALVLAPGNQAPDPLPQARDLPERLFAADPWGPGGRAAIATAVAKAAADAGSGDVLVVGSGLSMIDVALSLDAAGHRGRLLAVSRRGQMPRVHVETMGPVPPADAAPRGSLRALTRWVRREAGAGAWRETVDSLRPRSHELWQSLGRDDQRRFLRHARPWWDVHRHRIAPAAGRIVEAMIDDGRMAVMAGRVRSLAAVDGALEAVIRRRGAAADAVPRRFAVGINCTGPLHAIARTRDPLLRGLLDSGLAAPDALGIGLDVDRDVRVTGARRLWAMGSLGKAMFWEIIAVPDIRVQADAVAEAIAGELG